MIGLHRPKRAAIGAQAIATACASRGSSFAPPAVNRSRKRSSCSGSAQRRGSVARSTYPRVRPAAAQGRRPPPLARRPSARTPIARRSAQRRRVSHGTRPPDLSVGVHQAEMVQLGAPIEPKNHAKVVDTCAPVPLDRPVSCITLVPGARGATSHWMSVTVHLAKAQVFVRRSRRKARLALPAR